VVHADIRPSFDMTSNIMAKQDGSDMILVDLDNETLPHWISAVFSGPTWCPIWNAKRIVED